MNTSGGRVQFYERVKELQDVQYESESKRLELEQQLNSYVKSDSRMARLKAARLQNYWKKICEDEKRSQWRNEQLLQDFDRVEAHIASLDSRTERLRTMKKQYEEYIERMYPQWKEKVIFHQQQRIQAEKRAKDVAAAHTMRQPLIHSTPARAMYASQPQATPQLSNGALQYVGSVARNAQIATEIKLDQARSVLQQQINSPGVGRGLDYRDHYAPPADHMRAFSPGETHHQYPGNAQHHVVPSAGSTLQTISSLPTGMSLTSIQAQALAARHDLTGTWESTELESAVDQSDHVTARPSHGGSVAPAAIASKALDDSSPEETVDSLTSPKETTIKPVVTQHSNTGVAPPGGVSQDEELDTWRTDPSSSKGQTPRRRSQPSAVPTPRSPKEDVDVFSDADSLPLSSRDSHPPAKSREGSLRARPSTPTGPSSRKNSQSSILEEKSEERAIYPEASVTLAGLYNMLDAVQDALKVCRWASEFYRSQSPPPSVRNDIITNANKGMMLSHVDATSVSMVVLEELPLLVINSDSGTLLPDQYLYKAHPSPDSDMIRSHIDHTCAGFWDRLCEHFAALVRFGVMQPLIVGDIFAPLIIAEDSPYEDKAREVLAGLLCNIEVVDPQSPSSTATLSSMPHTPKSKQQPRPEPKEEVPPLDLPSSIQDKSEDVDSFLKPLPADPSATAPLTQTAAYRQLLGNTLTTQMSIEYQDTEDDEDDIEKQISKSLTSPRIKSPQQPMSVQPSQPITTKIPDGRQGDTTLGSGVSSPTSSPPLSPTTPAGYVPSGLTNTGKSTQSLTSTGKSAKKPAFRYGDSDTDEEIDLTGPASMKHGLEKDDFDFYD